MTYYNSSRKPKKTRFSTRLDSKKYLVLTGIIFTLCFLYYVFFLTAGFNVKEVALTGLVEADVSRITDTFNEKLVGKKIFLIRKTLIEDFINTNVSDYKFSKLTRIYPGKLIIEVQKRNASVVVKAPNGTYIVDKENFVMGSTNSFIGYTVNIEYDKPLTIGETLSDQVLIGSFKYSGSYGVVYIENGLISIKLNEGGIVILPADIAESQIENLSITLQKIIQKYTIENKEIDTIDLRFSKPLIKYK